MQSKTEELLNLLLWAGDIAMRPTPRNLTDSYESWAYRNGLLKHAGRLEKKKLVKREQTTPDERLCRLTEEGRIDALGGRDPEAQWGRQWDGCWRLASFDVPNVQERRRVRLRRYLRNRGFGCLQNSVWVSPDPFTYDEPGLAGAKANVESLIFMEAKACAGESDEEIVLGAWDFKAINRRYAKHMALLDQSPPSPRDEEAFAKAAVNWMSLENKAWREAVEKDPLLPARLLPTDYLGMRAWRRRAEVLQGLGRALQQG